MELKHHARFKKHYKKLKPTQKKRLQEALKLFKEYPHHTSLYNHPLTGRWNGHRSISFGGDWRAVYYKTADGVAYFVALGTHSQLYK